MVAMTHSETYEILEYTPGKEGWAHPEEKRLLDGTEIIDLQPLRRRILDFFPFSDLNRQRTHHLPNPLRTHMYEKATGKKRDEVLQ